MRVGLVGCTKSKLYDAAPAAELYSPSALFRGRRMFVERSCDRWFVLSAKHGVLAPEEPVEPYDETLVGKSPTQKKQWSGRVLIDLEEALPTIEGVTFEIHAGSDYRNFGLVDGLTARGGLVDIPTEGLTQGQQLRFYAEAR